MNLRDYLYFERKTLRNFAAELMIHEDYLGRIVRNEQKPSKRLAHSIERATEGKVTVKELIEDSDKKLK